MNIDIRIDDLRGSAIAHLLTEHLEDMLHISPRESVHALDLEALRAPEITCWSAWQADELMGCGALKEIDPCHGEIKSMRTAPASRRRGIGRALLNHVLQEARSRRYSRLSLETGSQPEFQPARMLYASAGFIECPPFAGYREDPNSVFMSRSLQEDAGTK